MRAIAFRERVFNAWKPLVGTDYAKKVARAWVPVEALLVLFPLWWIVGLIHSFVSGLERDVLGALNAAFGVVLIAVIALVPLLLLAAKRSIRRNLRERGISVRHYPPLVSPRSFRDWLEREHLAASDVLESLDLPYRK